MGRKVKTSTGQRIKNKEGRNRKYQIGRGYILGLAWGEKEEGNKHRLQSWHGNWGLADWGNPFVVKLSISKDMKVI